MFIVCTTCVAVDAAATAATVVVVVVVVTTIVANADVAGSEARSHSRQSDESFLIKTDSLFFHRKYMIQDHSTITARIFIATYIVDVLCSEIEEKKSKTIKIFHS